MFSRLLRFSAEWILCSVWNLFPWKADHSLSRDTPGLTLLAKTPWLGIGLGLGCTAPLTERERWGCEAKSCQRGSLRRGHSQAGSFGVKMTEAVHSRPPVDLYPIKLKKNSKAILIIVSCCDRKGHLSGSFELHVLTTFININGLWSRSPSGILIAGLLLGLIEKNNRGGVRWI